MKRVLALMFCFASFPCVAISEPIKLDCSFGFWGGIEIIFDKDAGQIGMLTATEVHNIPFIDVGENVVIAFWVTPDGQQFLSLSFNTLSGEIALASVGTREPLLRQGDCSREASH